MFNINDILKIDNQSDILNYRFKFDNLLIWPFVRYKVLYKIQQSIFNIENHYSDNIVLSKKQKIQYLLNALIYSPYKNKKTDIIYFSSGVVNSFQKDGKWVNRLYDYYAFLNNKSIIIEDSYKKEFKRPRAYDNVSYNDNIKLKMSFEKKINKNKKNEDDLIINKFIEYIKDISKIDEELFFLNLRNDLFEISDKLYLYKKYYKKLFEKIQPKIIFKEDGYYGGIDAYIFYLAHEMGINTGEFQHGLISPIHLAYNLGNNLHNNEEYKKYVPDYFLTFGEYWSNVISIPSEKVIIGSPYFYDNLSKYSELKIVKKSKKSILVISDGTLENEFTKFISEFLKEVDLNKFEVLLKLHPCEFYEKRYEQLKQLGIKIIGKEDIYKLLNESDYIVGCYSTVLFEAIAFGKNIFIYKNDISDMHIPNNLGIRFINGKELYNQIVESKFEKNKLDVNQYWNKEWERNFKEFLKSVGVGQ